MVIKLNDVANAAGISVSAASKALNNKSDVSDELKHRVKKVADDLGYKKNMLASRLVSKKSNTIGVFFFSRSKAKKSESSAFKFITVMLEEAKKKEYDIVLFSVGDGYNRSYIDLCLERQVEGAVIIGFNNNDTHRKELETSEIPFVMIENHVKGPHIGRVSTNNKKGIETGLNFLLEMSHEKIAFIKGPDTSEVAIERYEEFKKILTAKNCFDEELIIDGDFSLEGGYKAGKEILGLEADGKTVTAVFAANDLMAVGLIKAFEDSGKKVPDDISVLGYDNFEMGKYITPRLTTIAQDFDEIGIRAMELMFKMIDKPIAKEIYIEPELVVRDSVKRNKKEN